MEIASISKEDIMQGSAIGIGIFEGRSPAGPSTLSPELAEIAKAAAEKENFKAKPGNSLYIPVAAGSTRAIVLVGLGSHDDVIHADRYRDAAYTIVRTAAKRGISSISIALTSRDGTYGELDAETSSAAACGAALAGYRFDKYLSEDPDDLFAAPERVDIACADAAGLTEGRIIASAQMYARDLANEPGCAIDPATFEEEARRVAGEHGFQIEVLEADELERRGMNALLAVGSGSKTPPRLIHLTYHPSGYSKFTAALVGKGITFDSGGLSLKPHDSMLTMKGDKTGACVVLGALCAIAELKIPATVHAFMGMAENMPSGSAYRVDDIIRAYNGKTIEIVNTDAEGRVTLADVLAYACDTKPAFIIDIATLTGACAVALGESTAGLFSNDDEIAEAFLKTSANTGERFWRLPMDDPHLRKAIKSPYADIKNSGGRMGGAITAAMFLENFITKGTPWIHLDIAAADFAKEEFGCCAKGATAFGCRTITEFILNRTR